jgi:hypothetical protein
LNDLRIEEPVEYKTTEQETYAMALDAADSRIGTQVLQALASLGIPLDDVGADEPAVDAIVKVVKREIEDRQSIDRDALGAELYAELEIARGIVADVRPVWFDVVAGEEPRS